MGKGNFGGVGMSGYITLYPSNWVYNASVIGFLKVIQFNNDNIVENWLRDDGSVTIERTIFESERIKNKEVPKCIKKLVAHTTDNTDIEEWLNRTDKKGKTNREKYRIFYEEMDDFGYKFIQAGNKLFASNTTYQNLVQLSEWQSFDETGFINFVKNLAKYGKKTNNLKCAICASKTAKIANSNSKLEKRLLNFQEPHMRILAPSIGAFPNAFWNLNDSLLICPLCSYLIIHHHIPFESARTQSGTIFINAPSFKVMWYLNKFAEQILSNNKSYQIREILGISFMEFAQKVFVTLGAWSIMNIEMVIKKVDKIDYYSLPYEISRVLLQKEIASLISATKEPLILEIILNGKFSHLLTLSHKILRYSITDTNAFNDKYLSQLRNKDAYSLKNLSKILPELYVKINSITSREVMI